jgi:hypothetical protein
VGGDTDDERDADIPHRKGTGDDQYEALAFIGAIAGC